MKKTVIVFLTLLITISSLVFFDGCVKKTEYDRKEIVSIHYNTTESFIPWQSHKYYDFTKMTYATKRIIAEWYDDPEVNPAYLEREEYTVIASFEEEQAKSFFKNIKRHGIYNFENNYHANDVWDGSCWRLTITFSDGTAFESGGYMKYPKESKKIDNDFLALAGYELFDLWEY